MRRTERFRQQHNEIVEQVRFLEQLLNPSALSVDAGPARRLLSSLAGKLSVHLAAEDQVLYPEIKGSADPAIKKIAAEFERDMLPLSQAFKSYVGRWPSPTAISQDPATFVAETKNVCKALMDRIKRENSVFYEALDAVR